MAFAQSHRRRVALFLVVVVLTSVVLVGLGIRLIMQEREIRASRLAEERRSAVSSARSLVITELDDVERRVLGDLEGGRALHLRDYSDPAVQFLARIEDGRLVLPWDEDPALIEARTTLLDPAFAGQIRLAERSEQEGDSAAARRRYRELLREARFEPQRALVQLLLARSSAAGARSHETEQAYLDLLETPASVVDEYGVPFALYAAARLHDWEMEGEAAARRLRSETEALSWRSPTAAYLLQDLLAGRGIVPRAVQEELSALQSALDVERGFPLLLATRARAAEGREADGGWMGLGAGDWLARAVGATGAEPIAVVAVSAEALTSRLTEGEDLRTGTAGYEIRPEGRGEGIPLGVSDPDLEVVFNAGVEDALARESSAQETFLVVMLVLLMGLTAFGGYLLLHDVKREMTLAGLRSDFVSSVSHEVKTPLTSIRMFAETLRSSASPDPVVTAEYLDTIVGESERLTRLLDNVLDLSKIDQGLKAYARRPASLAEIVRRAARAVEYSFAAAGFRLTLDLDEALPPVSVDPDAVEQAVLNLLTNAMKYSGDAREVDLTLRRIGGDAVISVLDHGIGVPLGEQARLTEKFYRVRSSENDGIPGTGLGLTIVQHMAEAHGGRVAIASTVGEGSTFSIHLPLQARS